jgi:hypothetical protein
MGSKYYVSVRPQTNDHHAVHKEGCPFLPEDGKRIFLGEFRTGMEAEISGNMHFRKAKQCRYCCKDFARNEKASVPVMIRESVSSAKPALFYQGMICCIN